MSSREIILNAIKKNKPEVAALPDMPSFAPTSDDLVNQFIEVASGIGAVCIKSDSVTDITHFYNAQSAIGNLVVNEIAAIGEANIEQFKDSSAAQLSAVEYLFLQGKIGVAENGAVWVTESIMQNRMLPFICKNLVFLLNAKDIVSTLHDAYSHIEINEEGYGVFIAGPSKTADIEQSLVIGAHGPLSLHLFIME